MQVTSRQGREIQLTLEAAVDAVNHLVDGAGPDEIRELLRRHGFTRAPSASATSVRRAADRLRHLAPLFGSLPTADVDEASKVVNSELAGLSIVPWLTDHDGAELHIHWTPAGAPFDDQVVADVLMALAHELCEHGITRFGRCDAADCDHLFYDATRNRSRRFCADPRCASRTHTADHRARQRGG